MFCKQNAYAPKSLDSSSILQRIHTKTGTTARKLISKQDFLQPYFDGEFSDVHSSRIAQNIERYIKVTKKYQRETKFFVEAVLNRIYLLHKYNLKVAEVTFKYPLTPNFTQLLLRYVVLECSVLYKREHHTPRYEVTVQERILKLLQNVYNSYLESLNGVPPEKLLNERCTAILNLFIKIKSEFEVHNDLMENIAKKLLMKMGRLEQVNALKKKCIPCPLDTFLSDPAVVNSYKNIITSDYGTDDDLKIEEEVIQVDAQNEDNDSNEEPDIKQDISEILRLSNGLHQVPTTNGRVKKVPTIYIDDDNEEMLVLEEEIETSSKSARRQRAEEEKKLLLREKQYEMFSGHKPFDDVKPYVKDEVIDLNSDEESGTTESCRSNDRVNTRVAVEVVVIDDDADSTDVQPPDSPKVIKELNEEDILELSSDEDESPNVIPKEEEEELLRDETDDQVNRSSQSVEDSKMSNTALHEVEHSVHSNTSDINDSNLSQVAVENNISVDSATEPSNMPYPSLTDILISSGDETFPTQRENVTMEEQSSNDSAEGTQREIKLERDTPKDNADNQDIETDGRQTVGAYRESTENSEDTSFENKEVKNETENVTEEDSIEENIDLNMENGEALEKRSTYCSENCASGDMQIVTDEDLPEKTQCTEECNNDIEDNAASHESIEEIKQKSEGLHVVESLEVLEKDPINESGTSIKPKGIHRNSLIEAECSPLTDEENLVSRCENIEQNRIEDLENSLLDQEEHANTSAEQTKANDSDDIVEASEVEEALLKNEDVDSGLTVSHRLEVTEDLEARSENTERKSRPEVSDSRFAENNEVLEVPPEAAVPTIPEHTSELGGTDLCQNGDMEMSNLEVIVTNEVTMHKVDANDQTNNVEEFDGQTTASQLKKNEEDNIDSNEKLLVDTENVDVTCNRVPLGVIDDTTATESMVSSTDEAKDEPIDSMNWNDKNDDSRENNQKKALDQPNTDTEILDEIHTEAARDQPEEDTSSIDVSDSKEQTVSNMVQAQEEIVEKCTDVDVDQQNGGSIENPNVTENETITEVIVEPDTKCLEEANINTRFEDAEITDKKNSGNENLDRINETGGLLDGTGSGTKEFSKGFEGEGTSEDSHKEQSEGNKVSEDWSYAGDNSTSDQPFKPSRNEVKELNEGIAEIIEKSEEVEASSYEIRDIKEAGQITEEPNENSLNKKIVDGFEDVVVNAPSNEMKEIKEVEQTIGESSESFLDKTIVDGVEVAVNDTTNDHTESTLTGEASHLQTNEENIETQEIFQFRNTEHEIVITAEDVGHFELIEQEVHKTDNIPAEERYVNEKVAKDVDGFPENAYVGPTSHETEIISFEAVKSTDPNITEEICYGKYNEPTLIDDLNIQKEEIITEVHTLDLSIPEEFVINGSHSQSCTQAADGITSDNEPPLINQIVPAPMDMEIPLMKAEELEIGDIVTNNQIIPKQVGKHLEIRGIPDENTSLDILATVASEMSRQDLLKKKKEKKKKKVHNERRKKQFNLKTKIECVQERHGSKVKLKDTLNISAEVEKRVTRRAQIRKKTEVYLEPKCKPHDFVLTNDSGVPPPSNNIYTQKLSEIPLTSEDSNDSEGILLIDEDIDVKSNKPNLPQIITLPCYDEDTTEENIIFRYEPKVRGTVLISIPDTYQGNFEFLTQIEQLDNCSSHPIANVQNSQSDVFPEEKTYFGDLPFSKTNKNVLEIKPDVDIGQKSHKSILEKKNHKPFRTKAEQKDYDKFSLKPYVSIERLNITSKKEEKHKQGRSANMLTVCGVNNSVLKNEPTETEHEKVFKDEINNLPTKIKVESNMDETNREDSDDDIPLLQRTQFELKQTKKPANSPKSVPETKKEKSDRRTSFDKTTKVKSGDKSKTKPKKTHVDVKDDGKRLPKKLINEEKTTNTSLPNTVPATVSLLQTSVHPTTSLADMVEKDTCPASSEPETDKNNAGEPLPKSNQQIKSEGPSYEEYMKSSNTKYYTTPKLRRKSVSKHNLNRSDIKFEDTKKVIFNADKKYYTPPKLRRKSMAETENSTDTKKIAPKQMKVSTSKVDILSKCKNTISPTTEKLKKKLEIDFKLNCTELSAEETHGIGDGDHVSSLETVNSDVTETTPVDSPENDVNDTNTKISVPDVSEQSIREEERDKELPVTQMNISETTECELNTKPENGQGPDILTDKKESKALNEISTVASEFTPPTIENPTEDIQEAELEICKTNTVDVSTTQSDSETNKIQDNASDKSGTVASENVEEKLIEIEENLDDLPLSKRTSISSHHELKEPEFKNEIKSHRKGLKKTASDLESNFKTENKQQNIPNTDDNIKIRLKNETIPKVISTVVSKFTPLTIENPTELEICKTNTVDISTLSNSEINKIQDNASNKSGTVASENVEETSPSGSSFNGDKLIEIEKNLDDWPLSKRTSMSFHHEVKEPVFKNEIQPHRKGLKETASDIESNFKTENKQQNIPNTDTDNIKIGLKNETIPKSKTKRTKEARKNVLNEIKLPKQGSSSRKDDARSNELTKSEGKTKKPKDNKVKCGKLSKKHKNKIENNKKKMKTKTGLSGESPKKINDETGNVEQDVNISKNVSSRLIELIKPEEMSEQLIDISANKEQIEPNSSHLLSKENSDSTEQLEGSDRKEDILTEVKNEGSKVTDKTEKDVEADAELVLERSCFGENIFKEKNANDKLLENSIELESQDNQFKDKSDRRAENKDDNNSGFISSKLSLKSKDINNDHHISRKKKNSNSRLKKLPNIILKPIKTKTSLVDKVLPANGIDVLENCNVLTSVKITNNSALKNKVHGKGNKQEKRKKDKKRTLYRKSEISKTIEKTKQEEDTETVKDKANKTENTDISQTNSTIGNLTEVPLTVVSEEIVDSSDYKANSIEKSNAELGLDEHVQRVEEETMEETPEIEEIPVSEDTNVKENIPMVYHESDLDAPVENPLDIEPSHTNKKNSVIGEDPNAKLPTDKPVEGPMEDERPSDINEQVLLSNQEPDSKPQVDISADVPLQSENSFEDNKNRCVKLVENNVVEETGNYTITVPLEKVSEKGNSLTDKVKEASDFDSNSTFQTTECKEKYDDNKIDGALNEQSVCEDKNTVLDEVDEEIKLEERHNDGNVHHQFVDSKADKPLDKNLQLETEQQEKKHIGEDDFDTTSAIEDTVVESIETQDENLETVPISDQEPEEIIKEKGSSPLTEVEKENDSPKFIQNEDKGLQNSEELIEHSKLQKKEQLTDLKDGSVKDNLEIEKVCENNVTDIKFKNIEEAVNECTPPKSENEGSNVTVPVNVTPNLSIKKGKRTNDTLTEEGACTEKKSKLSEIRIDVSLGGVQDFSTKSPKLHSPLSTSPRKKDKKSIECIISQLKEEKESSVEAKEELVKSPSKSPVNIDVGSLKKKLLQKIKGHNSFKGSQSGKQESDIVIGRDKTVQLEPPVLDSETVNTNTTVVPIESEATEVENGSNIVLTKEYPTTSVVSIEVNHNITEEQTDKVPSSKETAQNVQESEMNEIENARRETELMEVGSGNIHNPTLVEPVITAFASEITNNSVKDNSEHSSTTLEESEVSEDRHEQFDSPLVKDKDVEITVKDNDASRDPPGTDKESKEPIFSSTTDISGVFSNDNENKSIVESETSNAVKETSETADSSPLIKPENPSRLSPIEILSENPVVLPIPSCSLPVDASKNLKDLDSFDQSKKSFSNDCLEISPKKSMESVNSCVADFEPSNVDTNLLNLCDLMLHVDSVGNVTRRIEESVSSETVCMLSDIISTTISSTNNKLPCVTSATTIKFTFPVTSQADIKDQLIPMNEVDTKKGIFDDSPMSTEKLPPKNGSCLFSLNERMDDASSRTLTSSSISLNLQEVDFSKIPIDSGQAFDLISPNSMIQTSAGNNFINEIPGDNEVSDIMETRSSNTIDHNYTMEPLGGPLLSGRPEEEHIFSSAFNKNLVDSPGEFPLNDNQLPSELSESDDTYKLNLDNEYAVKNLVMLGGQTSDVNSFPLSNYNLSDIERMNLIEDSISNSEDNSNSLDTASLVTSMEHESRDIPSNAWTQFIADENSNQRVTVPSCGPRITSPFSISQNDIIQPGSGPCFDEDTLLKESPGAELKMSVKGSLELKENDPWAQFIANENLTQKVVVLPNEQYLTSSFPISQSDFIQSTTLISPCVDNEIILEGTSDLNMDNEQAKLKTCKDERKLTDTDVRNEQTSKSNVKRNKKPKKAALKDVPCNDDFLPKRTYSRTVLRAPLKKNASSSADIGKNPSQNKTTQPSEPPEANLKPKPASAMSFGEKSLPNVVSTTTEISQKDSKQNPKDVPANPPSKRSKLDLSHPSNVLVQNPLETSSPSVIPNNKKSTTVIELKQPTAEAKNLENLPGTILKTKETASNSAKSFVDTADKKSDAQTTPELIKPRKDSTKLLTDVPEEKPAQLLIDVSDKISDVHCNIAELVKFRKRGVNNKYSNNNSPLPAKESRSEAVKTKKVLEKPLTSTPKPELTPQERKSQHRDQKSPTSHLLAKSYTPKHEPESNTPHAQTKPSIKENKLETLIAADNKSDPALPQPCQSKSNHSIDSILKKEPKSSTSCLTGGLIKDYKSLKSQGVKRMLTTTENDGTQKKQMKMNHPEQRQSDNNIDKTFDNLLQQGNVNKLILLRVTEDNKLKPERKYSPSLKPGSSQSASNLPVRSRSKSKELNEATKKEIERRTSLLMKQHSKRDMEAFDKLRMDRSSPSVKLDGRSKEQREYNKHGRSSFESEHSWSREGGSGRTKSREDSRYGSLRSDKGRDQYHSDYNRRREAYYSDHVRGKEGHYSGYGGRRDGHHSNHSRSREHHFEHGSGSVPRSSGSSHPPGGRSSNVLGSYYKTVHLNQGEEQSSHLGSRHSSGPYMKRGATLTEEKQNELLNALRDMVHKQLNSSGFKKSSAEEDYAWIEKLNQFNETPQFIPQPSSPPSDHK